MQNPFEIHIIRHNCGQAYILHSNMISMKWSSVMLVGCLILPMLMCHGKTLFEDLDPNDAGNSVFPEANQKWLCIWQKYDYRRLFLDSFNFILFLGSLFALMTHMELQNTQFHDWVLQMRCVASEMYPSNFAFANVIFVLSSHCLYGAIQQNA